MSEWSWYQSYVRYLDQVEVAKGRLPRRYRLVRWWMRRRG